MYQKGLAPILIILLIALALSGYLLYNQQTKSIPSPQQTIQPIQAPSTNPTESVKPADTSNWKTYQNSYFSFKYPLNWIAKEIENPTSATELSQVALTQATPKNTQNFDVVFLARTHTAKPEFTIPNFNNKQKIVLDGVNGFRSSGYGGVAGTVYKTIVSLTQSQTEYYILGNNYSGVASEDFDQILSTFKFLGQRQTNLVANWKTYINTKYHYSVKYPPTWYLWSVHPYDKGNPGDYVQAYITIAPPRNEVNGINGGIEIISLNNNKRLSSNDYIKEEILPGEADLNNLQNVKVESLKLDNISDASLVEGLFAAANTPGPVVFITKDSLIFMIWGGIGDMKGDREIFNQMISTFSFTQ